MWLTRRHVAKEALTIVGQLDTRNTGDKGGFHKILKGAMIDDSTISISTPKPAILGKGV